MLRLIFALSLASSLAAQTYPEAPSPTRIADGPVLRAFHRHLPAEQGTALLSDFDGDGIMDVWASGELYVGRGEGIFRRTWSGSSCAGALAGDVDGDGWVDLVCSSGELLRNDASGGFVAIPGAFLPGARPMVLGDLDADGDLDALGSRQFGLVLILTNDGNGTFGETIFASLPGGSSLTTIVLGDVDGGGTLDVFLVTTQGIQLFLGDGSGGFVEATANLPSVSARIHGLSLGDVDGDLDLDAVLANAPGTGTEIWLNAGDGTFAVGGEIPSSGWTQAVGLTDVDGDGDLDAYLSKGQLPPAPVPPPPVEADSLALNAGNGAFQPGPVLPLPEEGSSAVTAGDVDWDGDVDLLVAAGVLRLLLGDGTGLFWLDDGGVPPTIDADEGVVLADLDGDGWVDALTSADATRALLGDGTGSFLEDPARLDPPPRPASDAAMGDVDGDGDLDLALANPYDGELIARIQDNQLYRNDGGFFHDVSASALPTYPEDRGITQKVRLADADGDGDLDLLYADTDDYDGSGAGITLYLNDGTGSFTDEEVYVALYGAYDFHLLDLEADGDPDLVVDTGRFGLCLLENDGTGSYANVTGRLPGAHADGDLIRWFVAGDLDRDGDDDLAGAVSDAYAFWYAGDGAGSFTDASWLLPPGVALRSDRYAATDLDGDLDLDLVGPTSLLENDGTGRFAWSRRAVEGPAGATDVDFADLDADGDLDAFWTARHDVVGSSPVRHVAARGLPRIGKELTLDLYGPSAEPWLLAASPARVRLPLGIGLLQLELSSAVALATGDLSLAGRAAWSIAVPSNPILLGTTLYWQALVGAPARLTNLERTTLTAF